ncbi:MAG: Glu/Leu/Phe/Val dehydrogenase dimerization domain-containing protein [Pedobacter sp.]|uniref:Glu/Leu/Phe/Val family dehydrogenase n=1 Tax=Pedobacter sp. TaxID=1411316 RepID=UPI0028095245|nr:Glu/Leu/Phe/Val dehydrogenase dimerization domain-containing protein [Pedobacter sp.]MDQ8005154.1 Glu/Leu/Phe/Val dehydrogenase dimerization domain-containing protein [Pedobacter sp.]
MPEINSSNQSILEQLSQSGHKKVVFCNDPTTGLKAIIAIHDTTLGPALGGVRMWNYNSEAEALEDVLRLSKGMTYKAAIAGLNVGGGTAVIIGDSRRQKTEALMRSFGRFVKNLNGEFIAGEDVGTTVRDMEYIRMETQHVTGVPESLGGAGNPAPYTAKGVYLGIKACVKEVFGTDELAGRSVVVQGTGNVGEHLVELLRNDNVEVYVTDINEDRMRVIARKYKAKAIEADKIFNIGADIYAPCALGATINDKTLKTMKFAIIAGSANNQLADEKVHGQILHDKGILYAPDYLINAGGIISCYSELTGFGKKRTIQLTENIYEATKEVIKLSKSENIPTNLAASRIAEKRIEDIKKIKSSY